MRIVVVVALAALMSVAVAAEVAAQRIPSGAPRVDLGAPPNRGFVGRDIPWSGPPRVNYGQPRGGVGPYFQPTPQPFQGSEARRWQQKLNEVWGGIPADRGVPQIDRRFGFPRTPRERIFIGPRPYPIIECFETRCTRTFPPIR